MFSESKYSTVLDKTRPDTIPRKDQSHHHISLFDLEMAVNLVILYGVQCFCFLLSFLIKIQKKGSRKGQLWHADCCFLLSDAQSSKVVKVCCCFWGSGTSVCMYSNNYLLLNAVTNALWLLGWLYSSEYFCHHTSLSVQMCFFIRHKWKW